MSQKTKQLLAAILAGFLALTMLVSLFLGLIGNALADTSGELAEEHYQTELEAEEAAQQAEALQQQAEEIQRRALDAVEKKIAIDQAIELLNAEIDGIKDEIQQLNLDIADKQAEVDAAIEAEQAMTERYKIRLRAMEERGSESYWAVIFRASSLSDLLDQLTMISEISHADQLMQEELAAAREAVIEEQQQLETVRGERAEKQAELEEKQDQLVAMRAEVDELILQLCADNELMLAAQEEAAKQEAELREKSKQLMEAYYKAVQAENAAAAGSSSNGASASGFMLPVPKGVATITDAYGNRWHQIKQKYSFHYGVDLACGLGTSVYATKSGTVIESQYASVNGNYVTIQHADGSSSLYAHLNSAAVSAGDYVSQGSVIGYVGTTGLSTGPHLHFEILINGSNVNPMDYVSLW